MILNGNRKKKYASAIRNLRNTGIGVDTGLPHTTSFLSNPKHHYSAMSLLNFRKFMMGGLDTLGNSILAMC